MATYAKIWTDIFNDINFKSLGAVQRGIFLQLIPYAKLMGDTGFITFRNWAECASVLGCERNTAVKFLRKFVGNPTENQRVSNENEHAVNKLVKIEVKEEENYILINLCKYMYHQHERQPGDDQTPLKVVGKSPIIREDKIREDKSTLQPSRKEKFEKAWTVLKLDTTEGQREFDPSSKINFDTLKQKMVNHPKFKTYRNFDRAIRNWINSELTYQQKGYDKNAGNAELVRQAQELKEKIRNNA